jgi:hypothetical protein
MSAPDEPGLTNEPPDRPAPRKRSSLTLFLAMMAGLALVFLVAWVGIGAYARKQQERQANINERLQQYAENQQAIAADQKLLQDYDQQLKALPARRVAHKRAGGDPRVFDPIEQTLRTKIRETGERLADNGRNIRDIEEELQKRYGVGKEEMRRLLAERE